MITSSVFRMFSFRRMLYLELGHDVLVVPLVVRVRGVLEVISDTQVDTNTLQIGTGTCNNRHIYKVLLKQCAQEQA